MYVCMYVYIYIYIRARRAGASRRNASRAKRSRLRKEAETLSPEFGDLCKNKTSLLYMFAENRFLPFAPVDLRRKPEPVPRTQVL